MENSNFTYNFEFFSCFQVLCSEAVASLLNGQFVLWPWDMSQADNRAKFIEWLGENNLTQVKDVAKYSAKDEFPLLFLLTKDRATINVEEIIRGFRELFHPTLNSREFRHRACGRSDGKNDKLPGHLPIH